MLRIRSGLVLTLVSWRKHIIICLALGLLAIPVFFLDRALMSGGGGNWIALDFRGLIFGTYTTLVALHVVLSTVGALSFSKLGIWRIHVGSFLLSVVLFIAGIAIYGSARRQMIATDEQRLMEIRRRLKDTIELKKWWYVPDDIRPAEIRVRVVIHKSGRFAGNVIGGRTDSGGSSTTVFESTNGPESQRQVRENEALTYVFPLKVAQAGPADDVRITLYLFNDPAGPDAGDIAKVFMTSPKQDDDGRYFYGILPAPER